MTEKTNLILLAVFAICVLVFCINRDMHLEKQYTGDLRNRIVGARLQEDGRLPYFYKWSNGDGLRYYDPQNFDKLAVSNITATPFLHELLYPIADLQQRTISRIWLGVEYLLLVVTVLLAFSFAKSTTQRWVVIISSAAFLFTSGWENHIEGGQYYLLVPALCMLLYYLFHKKNITAYLVAGIIASSLLLIRPNTIWFFIPFVFVFFVWPARTRIAFALAALLPLLFTITGPQKIAYWKNFRQALNEQTKAHQSLSPTLRVNATDPGYVQWEGWDKQEIATEAAQYPFNIQSEHGNLFVMSRWLFHINLPIWLLIVFPAMFLLLVLPVAYRIKAVRITDSLPALSMLAFCLYMLSDICSPFHRFQYNTAQWLFPLLLSAAYFDLCNIWLYGLILAGIALNIAEIPSVGYEHTAGEYVMFIAFAILGCKWALAAPGKINSRA